MATARNKTARDAERIAKIRAIIDKWGSFLGITQQWHIEIRLEDSITCHGHNPAVTPASITFNPPYVKALLQVARWAVDGKELEYFLLHELLHLIVEWGLARRIRGIATEGTLTDELNEGCEALCDIFARLLLRSAQPAEWEGGFVGSSR